MYFAYGKAELEALSAKDPKLAAVIAQVGMVQREVDTDLFSAVVHHIIGQQISTKAQATIWQRMRETLGTVDAAHILAAGAAQLQALGMSFRKAQYIMDFAQKVQTGEFDPEGIREKSDEEAIRELSALQGIGVWTAENPAVLHAAPRCAQLQRSGHSARAAHGISSPKDHPAAV